MSDFPKTEQRLLTQALAHPGETVIIASVDPQGGMVLTVQCDRALDLVQVARSLLEDAMQRSQDEHAKDGCDSQGDDPLEERISYLSVALDEISAIDGMDGGDRE
jgi:hypothetical protein